MSKVNPTELTTYTWDAQDQLVQINFPNSTTATYKYDGFGRRIEKNVNGTITRYIYDGEDILLEYDGTNTFVARYNHGDQVDQPLAVQRAGVGFFYYQADHQGSIRNLTDSSGTIANSYVYDSYGRTLTLSESIVQPFTYTGRELDPESGLYYYRARYYDSQAGRFLSEDPIGFAGGDQNVYRYVRSSPINFKDPNGKITETFGLFIEGSATFVEGTAGALAGGATVAAAGALVLLTPTEAGAGSDVVPQSDEVSSIFEREGKENIKDSGLENLTDSQIEQRLRDKTISKKEKRRLQKEQKARKKRNKRKRQNCP